jgi:hypothetical protein
MKGLTLHNFSYILCIICIYYDTDLIDSSLYSVLNLEDHSIDSGFYMPL